LHAAILTSILIACFNLKSVSCPSPQQSCGVFKIIKVALNAEINYFNNKTANEAIDGEFNILGKIIRVIKPESTDTINLLRNTSFRQLDLNLFNDLTGALKEAEGSGLNLPEIVTEIKAPAIQILPIAIFT
jgi:hypothetical protein